MKTLSASSRAGLTVIASLMAMLTCGPTPLQGQTQKKAEAAIPGSSCSRNNALVIIRAQIDASKTFDDTVQRITVLMRAADLLWSYQQEQARAAFTEGFDLATLHYKEKGEQSKREGRATVQVPDQRYTVITAIARRDPVWAGKLSEQILQDQVKEAEEQARKDKAQDARTADRLMGVAYSLLDSNQPAALAFARSSLRYTATFMTPRFLCRLSELNKPAADQFYREALSAYANAPMEQFLYLSSYPFGNTREAGEMPMWTNYQVPNGFAPNPSLQKLFLQTLLRRAQQLTEDPAKATAGSRFSEAAQISMALTRLESQVEASLPDLSSSVQQAKGSILPLLSQKDQQKISETLAGPPKKSFDELIEDAEKQKDPARREGGIALAVLLSSDSESLEHVVAAAEKIDDSALREQIFSQLYFNRAQSALKEKRLVEARRLAAKVAELDQRAYLYSQIVTESIKQTKNDAEARAMLDEVVDAAAKAPNTEIKARALLGVAYLYTKVEPNRAVSVLGDAVKTINGIESPDFSRDYVMKRIEGKSFGSYRALQTPGFNPENAFRELGKLDFDGTLYQTSNVTQKSLRALTTLALVENCLQQTGQQKDEKTKKKPTP